MGRRVTDGFDGLACNLQGRLDSYACTVDLRHQHQIAWTSAFRRSRITSCASSSSSEFGENRSDDDDEA
ncbi:hypothetical protein JTE90_014773 [Oedothorax gibbosus]|uniref:Uncharacterized protein n=1 Tax=Oedothorax gibbosus TaxID=931172 RepID=A0AAV6UAJ7_9ARAC|nr:hypothetical protein JTE90_014773 [Oedothorax gibbosus]